MSRGFSSKLTWFSSLCFSADSGQAGANYGHVKAEGKIMDGDQLYQKQEPNAPGFSMKKKNYTHGEKEKEEHMGFLSSNTINGAPPVMVSNSSVTIIQGGGSGTADQQVLVQERREKETLVRGIAKHFQILKKSMLLLLTK